MTYVVDQCIAAGLVSPDVHAAADGTQVRANASIHSLREVKLAPVETLEDYLARTAREDEQTEARDPDDDPPSPSPKSGEFSVNTIWAGWCPTSTFLINSFVSVS